ALGYLLTTAAMWRLRVREPGLPRPYRAPLATVVLAVSVGGSAGLVVAGRLDPWNSAGGNVPLEWGILIGWAVLGILFWFFRSEKIVGEASRTDRSESTVGVVGRKRLSE